MKKVKLMLAAAVLAFGLSTVVSAETSLEIDKGVKVYSMIISDKLYEDPDTLSKLKLCFTSAGGIDVRVIDNPCPNRVKFEVEASSLLKRLGAKPNLLKGYTVVFTKHMLMSVFNNNLLWVNGVTHSGKLENGRRIRVIALTVGDTKNCPVVHTLRHELGHGAFIEIGLSSDWLDVDEVKSCNYDDASALKRVVMVPGVRLPAGPIRAKFEAF